MIKQRGFTLIELILYVAIIALVIGALVPFAWNVIGTQAKSNTQQEVSSQARYLSERLKYEIRNAKGINTGTSQFDVNLVSNSSQQLSLVKDSPHDPTVINVVNGKVMIKQGSSAAVALHSADTRITNLVFSNYSSAGNLSENIQFTLTIEDSLPSARQEFIETINIQGSAEVRTNP